MKSSEAIAVARARQGNVAGLVHVAGSKLRFVELACVSFAALTLLLRAQRFARADVACQRIESSLGLPPGALNRAGSSEEFTFGVSAAFSADVRVNGQSTGFIRLLNFRCLAELSVSPESFAAAIGMPHRRFCALLGADSDRLPGRVATRTIERHLSIPPRTLDQVGAASRLSDSIRSRFRLPSFGGDVQAAQPVAPVSPAAVPDDRIAVAPRRPIAPYYLQIADDVPVGDGQCDRLARMNAMNNSRRRTLEVIVSFGDRLADVGIDQNEIKTILADPIVRQQPQTFRRLSRALGITQTLIESESFDTEGPPGLRDRIETHLFAHAAVRRARALAAAQTSG